MLLADSGRNTIHKDRVNQAIQFKKPDRTPRDFAAEPEVWHKLLAHFQTDEKRHVLERLGIDCHVVSCDSFCKPPEMVGNNGQEKKEKSGSASTKQQAESSGIRKDIWGASRRRIDNPFGAYFELCHYPLSSARNLEDLKSHAWPKPGWWDFGTLRTVIDEINRNATYNIRFRIGSVFETAWSLTSLQKFLQDLVLNPELPTYVMERIAKVHILNLKSVLETAADMIDIVYFYDDIATQDGLLLDPKMYEKFIQPFHQEIIELATFYKKPAMMHCCGSVYTMLERFIDMGLAIINPVQTSARDMEPEKLMREFGGKIVFHGAMDIQTFLPRATPEQVCQKTAEITRIFGENGGYILSGTHHFQADIPLNNVLAMYGL